MSRIALLIILGLICSGSAYAESEEVVDSVVATVNGEPITLHDVTQRLKPPRALSLKDAANDPEVQLVLDEMIVERLVEVEAEAKRVQVSDAQVDEYINQIAQRNGLSREGFESALKSEGRSFADYRQQVQKEILRSKLAASVFHGGVAVTDEEIEGYLASHPELRRSGSKVKLSQIFLSSEQHGDEQAKQEISKIREEFLAGESFDELAKRHSESGDAREGGALGVIAEEDLSPLIFEAIFSLKAGEVSAVTASPQGYHLFKVDERYLEDQDDSEKLKEEVRAQLKQQKLEAKMQTYFSAELFKNYGVEKKI